MPIFLSLEAIQDALKVSSLPRKEGEKWIVGQAKPFAMNHAHEIERVLRDMGLIAQSSYYRRFDEVSGIATFSCPGE